MSTHVECPHRHLHRHRRDFESLWDYLSTEEEGRHVLIDRGDVLCRPENEIFFGINVTEEQDRACQVFCVPVLVDKVPAKILSSTSVALIWFPNK